MDNYEIADQFSLLSKLMDIHGENSFKTKTYSNAAFQLERLTQPLESMSPSEIAAIRGIGDATAKKIQEIIHTGKLPQLEQIILNTPPGVLEMMNIKGLGPKKINIIWKEMEIETVGELLYACNENRLARYKGFGDKTEQNVKESIEFYFSRQGFFLYKEAIPFAESILELLQTAFPHNQFELSGAFRRQAETVEELEFVTDANKELLDAFIQEQPGIHFTLEEPACLIYRMESGPVIKTHCCEKENFGTMVFDSTGSNSFLEAFKTRFPQAFNIPTDNEKILFEKAGLSFIPAFLREDESIIDIAKNHSIPKLIEPKDIRAIIHSHSTWSDGVHSLKQMADAAISNGFEYMVISDHSRSAAYANGLSVERINQQHAEINALNKSLAPFKIFKSIESDILNDGSLDYPDEVLASFDLVIASVHSNLKMPEDKATARLIRAIENPYTTILGHMTGRLLLSRPGYPVDHKKIIEACAANKVVIELNAHSRRLDMDWRWIGYALSKNVLISIDPDAHSTNAFADTRYGVFVAQKGMLTAGSNLSSFTLAQFEEYLKTRKEWKMAKSA
jgi:DNA polymerase (family 10)